MLAELEAVNLEGFCKAPSKCTGVLSLSQKVHSIWKWRCCSKAASLSMETGGGFLRVVSCFPKFSPHTRLLCLPSPKTPCTAYYLCAVPTASPHQAGLGGRPPPQPCPVVSSKPACHFQVRIMIRRENTRPPGSHPECQGLCSKEVHSEQWWLLTFGPDCSPWWGGGVHCGMFGSFPGLSTPFPPQGETTIISTDIADVPWGRHSW